MRALRLCSITETELDRAARSAADLVVVLLDDLSCAEEGQLGALERWRADHAQVGLCVEIGRMHGPVEAALDGAMRLRPDMVLGREIVGRMDVEQLGAKIAVREAENAIPAGRVRILAGSADTARGVLRLPSLDDGCPRLAGLVFDPTRLAADLGCEPGPPRPAALAQAEAATVLAARAAGVPAVYALPPDILPDSSRRELIAAANSGGFSGLLTADATAFSG